MIDHLERPVEAGSVSLLDEPVHHPKMTHSRKQVLLLAGGLGLVSAGLIAAAPELGLASAVASVFAGGASAITTYIAKR